MAASVIQELSSKFIKCKDIADFKNIVSLMSKQQKAFNFSKNTLIFDDCLKSVLYLLYSVSSSNSQYGFKNDLLLSLYNQFPLKFFNVFCAFFHISPQNLAENLTKFSNLNKNVSLTNDNPYLIDLIRTPNNFEKMLKISNKPLKPPKTKSVLLHDFLVFLCDQFSLLLINQIDKLCSAILCEQSTDLSLTINDLVSVPSLAANSIGNDYKSIPPLLQSKNYFNILSKSLVFSLSTIIADFNVKNFTEITTKLILRGHSDILSKHIIDKSDILNSDQHSILFEKRLPIIAAKMSTFQTKKLLISIIKMIGLHSLNHFKVIDLIFRNLLLHPVDSSLSDVIVRFLCDHIWINDLVSKELIVPMTTFLVSCKEFLNSSSPNFKESLYGLALNNICVYWSNSDFLMNLPKKQKILVTLYLYAFLENIFLKESPSTFSLDSKPLNSGANSIDFNENLVNASSESLYQHILEGVQWRIESDCVVSKECAFLISESLSKLIDPQQPLHFDELKGSEVKLLSLELKSTVTNKMETKTKIITQSKSQNLKNVKSDLISENGVNKAKDSEPENFNETDYFDIRSSDLRQKEKTAPCPVFFWEVFDYLCKKNSPCHAEAAFEALPRLMHSPMAGIELDDGLGRKLAKVLLWSGDNYGIPSFYKTRLESLVWLACRDVKGVVPIFAEGFLSDRFTTMEKIDILELLVLIATKLSSSHVHTEKPKQQNYVQIAKKREHFSSINTLKPDFLHLNSAQKPLNLQKIVQTQPFVSQAESNPLHRINNFCPHSFAFFFPILKGLQILIKSNFKSGDSQLISNILQTLLKFVYLSESLKRKKLLSRHLLESVTPFVVDLLKKHSGRIVGIDTKKAIILVMVCLLEQRLVDMGKKELCLFIEWVEKVVYSNGDEVLCDAAIKLMSLLKSLSERLNLLF